MKKNKKPFFETKLGGVLKGIVREVPYVGGFIDNKNSATGGVGKLVKSELTGQIIGGGIILLAVLSGFGVISGDVLTQVLNVVTQIFE